MARFKLYKQQHTTYPRNKRGNDYSKPIRIPYWSIIDTTLDESKRGSIPADYILNEQHAEIMCAALNRECPEC